MCGIAGIVKQTPGSVALEDLKKMTDILHHRGPDGEGAWISPEKQVGLGHRRLSILDLSENGKQPMTYLSRYVITFNGEIYNYLEIKERLLKKGYKFHSTSDTEVLLALYDLEKENCLQHVDGMFSFAIWDQQEQHLFFARDRFGEKPFHYAYQPGHHFVFGSEMKALFAYGIPKECNNNMLYRYLAHNEVMNNNDLAETFYKNIFRLKAAHWGLLSLKSFELKTKQYWDIDLNNTNAGISDQAAEERYRELFETSLKRRLRSDVPVGSSLSGGLDSSVIVCLIDKLNDQQQISQNTFSARFPGFKKDEWKYMQMVIDSTNASPKFTFPDDNKFQTDLEKLLWHQEEPLGSASIYAQYEVMKLARENNVTVLLDGQGADEVLAGYPMYFPPYFRELRRANMARYQSELNDYKSVHADNTINGIHYNGKIKEWMIGMIPDNILKNIRSTRFKLNNNRNPFLNKDFLNTFGSNQTIHSEFRHLNKALYSSSTGAGLQELLRYADRNSMAHSREIRLPFLYHEMVEFVFSLPSNFKIRNGWTKYILRKSFSDILPAEIAWRKDKIGYEPPQKNWLQNSKLQEIVKASGEKLIKEGILDRQAFSNPIQDDVSKTWKILMSASILNK